MMMTTMVVVGRPPIIPTFTPSLLSKGRVPSPMATRLNHVTGIKLPNSSLTYLFT